MQSLAISLCHIIVIKEHLSPNLPIKVITKPDMKYFEQAEMPFLKFVVCFSVSF